MSTKHLKQIQSRLRRKSISVTYDNIRDEVLEKFPSIDLDTMSEEDVSCVAQSLLNRHQQIELNNENEVVKVQPNSEEVIESKAGTLATTEQSQLAASEVNQIEQLAPEEAITIIREIAEDETSKNKQLARELLEQADAKTTSIVALVAAMPQIEAEMLKRKLAAMKRKTVDYGTVLEDYFRSSQNITTHITELVSEFGISL